MNTKYEMDNVKRWCQRWYMDNGNVNMGLDNKYGDDDKNSALNFRCPSLALILVWKIEEMLGKYVIIRYTLDTF